MMDEGSESPGFPITAPPEVTSALVFEPDPVMTSETPPSPR
jgi:hypothetical protein